MEMERAVDKPHQALAKRLPPRVNTGLAALPPEDVPAWLSDWSALDAELMGVGAKLATFADLHTGNEAAQTRYAAFLEEVVPQGARGHDAPTLVTPRGVRAERAEAPA